MRPVTPRTLAIRIALFSALMVGCGSRGCGGEPGPAPAPTHQSQSVGCNLDFSDSTTPTPIACPATLDALPFLCSDDGLVCNFEMTDSRVRCECNGNNFHCVDFTPDLSVVGDADLGPDVNLDLGED